MPGHVFPFFNGAEFSNKTINFAAQNFNKWQVKRNEL